jgi:hypothetical protein
VKRCFVLFCNEDKKSANLHKKTAIKSKTKIKTAKTNFRPENRKSFTIQYVIQHFLLALAIIKLRKEEEKT